MPAGFTSPGPAALYAGAGRLAGWPICAGIAVSARSADARVAQQLGVRQLAPLAVVTLMSLAAMFDRERLITGGST